MVDTVSRTIRFKVDDLELIDEFLEKNPLFDFSSLTRVAIMGFIKNPTILLTAVNTDKSLQHPRGKEN
jgi:hypothetical protein